MEPPDYDEDAPECNDDYEPDGVEHHKEMPLSDNDKQIVRNLSDMFSRAWFHG